MFRVATVIATVLFKLESYHSKSKKKIGDGETVGGVFFVCLLSKLGFREPIGDALRASPADSPNF